MPFCPHCGAEHAAGAAFCSSCGRSLTPQAATATGQADASDPTAGHTVVRPRPADAEPATPPAAASPAAPAAPAAPPTTPYTATPAAPSTSGPARPSVDWHRLLAGNWLGAGLVALLTGLTSGLLALGIVALAKPVDFGLDNSLTFVAWLMTGAFGADLTVQFSVEGIGRAEASIGAISLTVTVISVLVAVVSFRRVTRGYTRVLDAAADAVRAALLFGLGMMVIALVFRSDTSKFGRGWGQDLSSELGVKADIGANAVAAFFLSFLFLLLVLLATCWARGDWWGGRVQRVRDWLAAPLYGVGTFGLLLPLAGVVGYLLLLTGDTVEDNDPTESDTSALVALVVAVLANGGFWLVGLGTGSAFGAQGTSSEGGSSSENHHLGHFADDAWGLWFAPLVMLVVLYVSALVVARKAGSRERVLPSLLGWVGVVLVTTPIWVRLSSLHGTVSLSGAGEAFDSSGVAGVVGWQVTLLLTVAALVVAVLVALQHRALDVATLRGHARSLGQRIQTNPGRPDAGPPGQPPVG